MIPHRHVSARSRQMGNYAPGHGVISTRDRNRAKGHGNGPLTGRHVHVKTGPWRGLDGVIGPRYLQYGRYWLRLDDGWEGVLPSIELEVL